MHDLARVSGLQIDGLGAKAQIHILVHPLLLGFRNTNIEKTQAPASKGKL